MHKYDDQCKISSSDSPFRNSTSICVLFYYPVYYSTSYLTRDSRTNLKMTSPLHSTIPNTGISLNILIIGAGLAGLSAAITLSQTGHDVTVRSAPFTHAPIPIPAVEVVASALIRACTGPGAV